ncbi:MAG TPA: type I restriction enzyme HsdR N-terminal domain-containing protein [Saprospiraceae bacterium]|nr:type I restriction enzyme HsdR N-terminal domain-containing protein [Saprospiraceae bacterium]
MKRHSGHPNRLFDPVRKKWVQENPEEWVRQCLVLMLREEYGIPMSRMAVEKQIEVHGLKKRFDLVIYDRLGQPFVLIECKAPEIPIRQALFDQAAVYNFRLKAPYLGITNGHQLILAAISFDSSDFAFIASLPAYPF